MVEAKPEYLEAEAKPEGVYDRGLKTCAVVAHSPGFDRLIKRVMSLTGDMLR